MPTRLTAQQTLATIDRLGIERPLLTAFALVDAARQVRYAMHAHSRHQLIVGTAGSFWVETPNRLHLCDAATGLWIPARCRHATTMSAHAALSIFFSPGRYVSRERQATSVVITPLLRQMAIAAAQDVPSLAQQTRHQFFDVFFALVARGCRADAEPALTHPADRQLGAAVEYLLAHLDRATVRDLASAAALSERTLRRRFLAALHVTPEHYMRRVRLSRAAQLLVGHPGASVLEIALQVGYANQSAFAAAFRRRFGVSPRASRGAGAPSVTQPARRS